MLPLVWIVHMLLSHHRSDFARLPQEDALRFLTLVTGADPGMSKPLMQLTAGIFGWLWPR